MKIGLFGGTFDPVHLGHLILAETCLHEANLDEVWFLPSYQPPHKQAQPITRFEQRVELLRLALVSQPRFRVETIEETLPAPSYTVTTVTRLQEQNPSARFCWIVGGDTLPELPTWHQPAELLRRVSLVAVPRPGVTTIRAEAVAVSMGLNPSDVNLEFVNAPLIEIASRDLRERVRQGRSIRFLVPRAVEEFINEKRLYQS